MVTESGDPCARFLFTPRAEAWVAEGRLVRSWRVSEPELAGDGEQVIEHERIPFVSYPYEWPVEMIEAAASLTLSCAVEALDDGYCLKDATPYNILFRGPNAVFVDALSFEPRVPGDPTWLPYAQFVRSFVLPLLVHQHFGLPPGATLLANRDGLEPEAVYRWCSWFQRLRPPFLGTVTLPNWLSKKDVEPAGYEAKRMDPERAEFVLRALLQGLKRTLKRAAPKPSGDSRWSNYLSTTALYDEDQFRFKEAFVRDAMSEFQPRWVLDVGCNEGHFSAIAAKAHASVVAIDSDPAVVGRTWKMASDSKLDILPLVVDLSRPTPATGWRNREGASFLDRAHGRFDLVMGLAVLHHMLVTERVPLPDALSQLADLSSKYVLLEFVSPDDPMFQRIVRGRSALYRHLTVERFEEEARRRFDVVRSARIDGLHRWLYLLRKKDFGS
ncbi:MAG: class I SAM-dependent methyltransferase [Bryobacteraceae bacterium]